MRTLAFDGRMGASGDMLLGALLAAGADRDRLGIVEEELDVVYETRDAIRCGISGISVDVLVSDSTSETTVAGREDERRESDRIDHSHDHEQSDDHEHGDGHDHSHEHEDSHEHSHDHAEGSGPLRSYAEVVEIVEAMSLPERVEADATAIFRHLGEAEASVHGTDLRETHFHEVGADDAIADIVGACLLVESLDVDRIVTTPLAAGGGSTEMSHGTYPIPTPAVVELAERADWSIRGGPVDSELLTPTGAAILTHFAAGVEQLPTLSLDASGYGVGNRQFSNHPNVLRALVGEQQSGLQRDSITVLETNLDDATPEELGGLQETLQETGALDVSVLPATMKKSRPGHLVKVVVKPENAKQVAEHLARETGTLGVREHGAGHRWIADRDVETVTLDIDGESFEVGVKVASASGEVYDVSAEFDDASSVAAETGLAIREIQRRAEFAAREQR